MERERPPLNQGRRTTMATMTDPLIRGIFCLFMYQLSTTTTMGTTTIATI